MSNLNFKMTLVRPHWMTMFDDKNKLINEFLGQKM